MMASKLHKALQFSKEILTFGQIGFSIERNWEVHQSLHPDGPRKRAS
ncbi:hypothetical protein JL09_g6227 [Pichia kudriavzevii]|uniref:Uncharacterized protein n=1 Tax=Pichia kudriavzevii TaxID=4909 RepID=A0A099NQ12_PICKU|nr:hypothetical protein JL09_g6227 [Pichia kudriavzevii]